MLLIPLAILAAIGLVILLRPWPFFLGADESQAQNTTARNLAWEFGKWVERQALARGLNVRGVARSVPIVCPKCRKASNYFVYPDELCERCWRATLKPISTSTPVKGNRL
jgi:hypothetical protein